MTIEITDQIRKIALDIYKEDLEKLVHIAEEDVPDEFLEHRGYIQDAINEIIEADEYGLDK